MDSSTKYENVSPEESANFFSRLFFCWVLPFFKIGYQKDLKVRDIYNATKSDLSGPLGDTLERNWNEEILRTKKNQKSPSLKRVIGKTFAKSYMFYGVFLFFSCLFVKMSQPVVLGYYIKYFDIGLEATPIQGWLLGAGVIALPFISSLIFHNVNVQSARIGMRVRIACCSLMYRKLLKLNHISLGKTAAGQLVNLMSNDVLRFDLASPWLHYIWIMPIQTIAGFYVMYSYIGLASIPTMSAMLLNAVLGQGYLSKLQGKYRHKIAQLTDKRVKLMSEITLGIQVIKMYAWEKPFEMLVEFARRKEVNMITRTSYIKGFSSALMVFVERAGLYIAVVSFVLLGNRITGEVVFSMAQLLNTVQAFISIFFPLGLSTYEEAKVSIRRIEEFLLMEENQNMLSKNNDTEEPNIKKSTDIKLVKVGASWLPDSGTQTIKNVDLEIKPGTFCCIVGSVGSGKSSLLQVLLKELPLDSGKMKVPEKMAYASQEPWLFNSNVRQNILFGLPYIRDRYKKVVEVCALQRDFKQLSHGDRTPAGEKGSALSGGQRARVALARAVYRDADAYLLDDPLSAVDAHVAKDLFENCIQGFLKNKTRVLVTHQVQFLKAADVIVVMNNGKIEKTGNFDELEDDLSALSKEVEQQQKELQHEKLVEEKIFQKRERINSTSSRRESRAQSVNSLKPDRHNSICSVNSSVLTEPDESEELLEKGSIKPSTYIEYYKAGASVFMLIFLVAMLIIAQVACNASDMWVAYWTNMEQKKYAREDQISATVSSKFSVNSSNFESTTEFNNGTFLYNYDDTNIGITMSSNLVNNFSRNIGSDKDAFSVNELKYFDRNLYIYVYSALILAAIVLTSARSILLFKICMNASKNLHNKMFANLLRTPMAFFDINPSGRILNRFSKDIGAMDEVLPKCTLDTLQCFLVMSGILGMAFIVNPWMMIPGVILGYLFVRARKVYLASAQDIKRLEGVTRAPVFSHVSATLHGLTSIRAYKAQDMIIREFDGLQDQHTATWYLFILISETLGFYLGVISTTYIALVTFQFLIFQDETTRSANVGLVIAHSLILIGMLQFGVRQSAEVSSNMTSVERVLQYTRLEEEGPWEAWPVDKPPSDWPQEGRVTFDHATLRYAPDAQPSVRDLNVEFQPGEKIGVVGRTGAGKSSLVASLFRLAPIEGNIKIDGMDTGKVGLRSLRSSISIIPQVPTLFSASLRYNLDPFEKCTDEQLCRALEWVELKQSGIHLETTVSEGGANFSAGQRQLICLARAIVRNKKVLVMDEATANVDQHTDALIQSTIREVFKDCTVITVAHRLNTIIDCDRILVMDAGTAVEFASPHELLQKKDGHFAKMIEQTGPSMEAKLRRIARETYEKRRSSINELDEKFYKQIETPDED